MICDSMTKTTFETEPQPTALYKLHQRNAAKLVDFAGYLLPLQFKGIRQEHAHTRERASLFDISHMGQIRLQGNNVINKLQEILPSNISDIKNGQQRYTVLLNDQAGIVDDLMVSRYKDDLILVVNAACKEKDLNYLKQHLDDSVTVELLNDRSLIAIQGPTSVNILQRLNSECMNLTFMQCGLYDLKSSRCFISRSGYTGEDGFEISIPNDQVDHIVTTLLEHADLELAGLGARDTLRLEAGLCLYGHDIDDTITPLEAGLGWVISKQRLEASTAYPGRDIIQQQMVQDVKRQRTGLVVEAKTPVREQNKILDSDGNIIGHVTSGSYSPSLNRPIAIAMLDKSFIKNNTELLAEVRRRTYPVRVTSLPFVPHRYHKHK